MDLLALIPLCTPVTAAACPSQRAARESAFSRIFFFLLATVVDVPCLLLQEMVSGHTAVDLKPARSQAIKEIKQAEQARWDRHHGNMLALQAHESEERNCTATVPTLPPRCVMGLFLVYSARGCDSVVVGAHSSLLLLVQDCNPLRLLQPVEEDGARGGRVPQETDGVWAQLPELDAHRHRLHHGGWRPCFPHCGEVSPAAALAFAVLERDCSNISIIGLYLHVSGWVGASSSRSKGSRSKAML
eukprot:3817232-Rhodomonas_salina.2